MEGTVKRRDLRLIGWGMIIGFIMYFIFQATVTGHFGLVPPEPAQEVQQIKPPANPAELTTLIANLKSWEVAQAKPRFKLAMESKDLTTSLVLELIGKPASMMDASYIESLASHLPPKMRNPQTLGAVIEVSSHRDLRAILFSHNQYSAWQKAWTPTLVAKALDTDPRIITAFLDYQKDTVLTTEQVRNHLLQYYASEWARPYAPWQTGDEFSGDVIELVTLYQVFADPAFTERALSKHADYYQLLPNELKTVERSKFAVENNPMMIRHVPFEQRLANDGALMKIAESKAGNDWPMIAAFIANPK